MTDHREVTEWLQHFYGDGHVIFGSRASGLLHSYLLALNQPGTGVVIPAITCHALMHTIELAGYQPIFADIEKTSFLMTTDSLEAAVLRAEKPVSACIAVHTFGHLADVQGISAVCQQHGLHLIEDACQILDGTFQNSASDAVLFSFGHSKPVDIGGGGAMLIRDLSIADAHASRKTELHARGLADENDQYSFSRDYYAIRDRDSTLPGSRREVRELAHRYSTLALSGSTEANWSQLSSGLTRLAGPREERVRRAHHFMESLPQDSLELPSIPRGSSPWRFTFLVKDPQHRDPLVGELRAAVRHASTWYPSLALDYGSDPTLTPTANDFENRVINLWLAEGVDDEYVEASIRTIQRFFSR